MPNAIEKGGESEVVGVSDDGGGGADSNDNKNDANIENKIISAAVEHERILINKWRVRVGFPITSAQVIAFYQLVDENGQLLDDKTIYKLKANNVGMVKKRLYKEGDIVAKGAPIIELGSCSHATVIKDMCANCGADLRHNENGNTSDASVPMIHSMPDLKVTQKLAKKLGHEDTRRLLQSRKLVLLVDLDQTVIHTTNDNVPNHIKGIYHFQLYGPHSPWYHTRLRPGTASFLERMTQLYELHICTFGARNYAHMIAQLLDPQGKFFSHRILSRDECFNATSKTDNLKALFPNGDSMVCIIDDREDVWNMAPNLIQVKPYHFFQHTGDINAPPGLSKHELDGEGVEFKDMDSVDTENNDNKTKNESKTDAATATENKNDNQNKIEMNPDEESTTDAVTSSTSKSTTDVDIDGDDDNDNDNDYDDEMTKEPMSSTDADQCVDTTSSISETTAKANVASTTESNCADVTNVTSTIDNAEIEPQTSDKGAIGAKSTDASNDEPSTSNNLNTKPAITIDMKKLIEIPDPDDYLLYLEVILKNIHARFYSIYDKTSEIPDLKIIVPKIRSEVLRGLNLVFSGLVPNSMQLEQSRPYFIAKSLGANVTQNIEPDTTHLVAVNCGTFKVNTAKKNSNIKIVNANWLWSCAERWEHVEEKLFPLDRKVKGKHRQPPAHCHSPEHVVNYTDKSEISSSSSAQQQESEMSNFKDSLNPLLSFTNADLLEMNKDFDQFFESDSSSEDEHVNIENPPLDKKLLKRKRDDLTTERITDFFMRDEEMFVTNSALNSDDSSSDEDGPEREIDELEDREDDEDDDEVPSAKFRRGEDLPSDLDIEDDSDSSSEDSPESEDDGEWNMMGAALEREFLGLNE